MAKPSLYDQFIWFGDSLTQQAWAQEVGFAAGAAVQNCEFVCFFFFFFFSGKIKKSWFFWEEMMRGVLCVYEVLVFLGISSLLELLFLSFLSVEGGALRRR